MLCWSSELKDDACLTQDELEVKEASTSKCAYFFFVFLFFRFVSVGDNELAYEFFSTS